MSAVVSRQKMKLIAEQIVATFPTEEEKTYFYSYMNPKTKKMCAKGKLVYKFYNTRRENLSCGLVPKTSGKSISKSQVDKPNVLDDDDVHKAAVLGSICWLEENSGGRGQWSELLTHWQITSKYRLNRLISAADEEYTIENSSEEGESGTPPKKSKPSYDHDREKTAAAYMKRYPAFEENSAFMLFEVDFRTLWPNIQATALFSEWATLSSFIVLQVRESDAEFLKDPTLTRVEKTLITLQNLSRLFPVVNVSYGKGSSASKRGKGKKKSWRPSHAEVTDAFLTIHPTIFTVEELKDKRREELRKIGLSLQPFVAVLGPVEQPLQFLVCVDEFFCEVDSPLKATDVAFKSFFALHTPFPPEAEQLWLFLQKAVYGFSTPEDGHFNRVNTLCNEYSRFKLASRASTSQ